MEQLGAAIVSLMPALQMEKTVPIGYMNLSFQNTTSLDESSPFLVL